MNVEKAGDLANAAAAILGAGCGGLPGLTWNIRLFLDGERPGYPAGDAWHDDKQLYDALEKALRLYMLTDGYEPTDADIAYAEQEAS